MSSRLWLTCCFVVLLISGLSMTTGVSMASGDAAADPTCLNLVQNSNMELGSGWLFAPSPAPGIYTTEQAFSPTRSARLGITTASNVNAFSSMRQTIVVPSGDTLRLRLQVLQLSQPLDPNAQQEIRILDATTGATLRQVWSSLSNDAVWKGLQFDLSEFLGRTIVLYINARNDGAGGRTAMYVDDVVLELCSEGGPTATWTPTSGFVTATPTPWVVTNTPTPPLFVTATPTPVVVTNTPTPGGFVTATPTPVVVTNTPTPGGFVTATPTAVVVTNTPTPGGFVTATPTFVVVTNTPTPTVFVVTNTPSPSSPTITPTFTPIPPPPGGTCKECLLNTGFEEWGSWYFAKTNLQAAYSGAQAHTGIRSAVMGNPNPSAPNFVSYSSVRQKVVLPKGEIRTAFLDFWHYTVSDLEGDDRQEAIILDANTGRTLEVLWRVNRNDRAWQPEHFDLTRYLGRAIVVYFNVYNGGGSGRASMYIDDVQLSICGNIAPAPAPPTVPVTTGVDPEPPLPVEIPTSAVASDQIVISAIGAATPSFPIATVIASSPSSSPPLEMAVEVSEPGLLTRFWNFIRQPLNCFLTIILLVVFGLVIYLLLRIVRRIWPG